MDIASIERASKDARRSGSTRPAATFRPYSGSVASRRSIRLQAKSSVSMPRRAEQRVDRELTGSSRRPRSDHPGADHLGSGECAVQDTVHHRALNQGGGPRELCGRSLSRSRNVWGSVIRSVGYRLVPALLYATKPVIIPDLWQLAYQALYQAKLSRLLDGSLRRSKYSSRGTSGQSIHRPRVPVSGILVYD